LPALSAFSLQDDIRNNGDVIVPFNKSFAVRASRWRGDNILLMRNSVYQHIVKTSKWNGNN
tara:strand:+ start:111 stop:293 length:183 start_codon:yes stop_codon:yes gene_type:complete